MIIGTRKLVLLGILLLIGTAGGAWLLHQPAAGDGPSGGKSSEGEGGVAAVALGYVDVEPGISFLHPVQKGRVTQVFVKEGDEVRQGDLLLSIDNTLARQRLREAQAALDAAEHEQADAEEKLPKEKQHEIDIQTHKLKAAQFELKSSQKWLETQRKLHADKENMLLSDAQLAEAENKVKAIEETVKAQEAALKKAKDFSFKGTIDRLHDLVKVRQAQRDQARQAVLECDLYAPADGVILRLFATPGDPLNNTPKTAAVHFCPDLQRVIRVEVLQEWASKLKPGQVAYIEDDTRNGVRWKGKVVRVSDWFTQRRSMLQEPFQYNDVRTLECIVYLDPGSRPVRIGQRVRVTIK
jgi:multidrug resistance efflux pump